MNTDRKLFLRRALASQLESVGPASADGRARAQWLGEQLENYIERWFAFQPASSRSALPSGNDDLFVMMEVGAELLGEELTRTAVPTGTAAAWRDFLAALERVGRENDSERQVGLRETFAAVRATLIGTSR